VSEFGDKVDIEILIDTVQSMEGKGQYIYVHLDDSRDDYLERSSDGKDEVEPIFKFNNGYYGGSHDVLKNKDSTLPNQFAGAAHAVVAPELRDMLAEQ